MNGVIRWRKKATIYRWKFCYQGNMISVDGDADAAVEARIRIGWNKFRQLVPLLTNKDVSLTMDRNIVQQLCAKQYVAWK